MTCIIKDIEGPKLAWCGASTSCRVSFLNIDHFVIARSNGSIWGHPVCEKCLQKVLGILNEEVGSEEEYVEQESYDEQ